jgi:hypothetical protein
VYPFSVSRWYLPCAPCFPGCVASSLPPPPTSVDRRRVLPGDVLQASFGRNALLVTYPAVVGRQFPDHVTNATVYGRLLGSHALVNFDVELAHNDAVSYDFRQQASAHAGRVRPPTFPLCSLHAPSHSSAATSPRSTSGTPGTTRCRWWSRGTLGPANPPTGPDPSLWGLSWATATTGAATPAHLSMVGPLVLGGCLWRSPGVQPPSRSPPTPSPHTHPTTHPPTHAHTCRHAPNSHTVRAG